MKKILLILIIFLASGICYAETGAAHLGLTGGHAEIDWAPILAWMFGGVSLLLSLLFGIEKRASGQLKKVIDKSSPDNKIFLELAKSAGLSYAEGIIEKIVK